MSFDFVTQPVFPIPVSFSDDLLGINKGDVIKYLGWLQQNGVKTIMTTVGTSQFNYLTSQEIWQLNKICDENFNGNLILGLPVLGTHLLINEMKSQMDFLRYSKNKVAFLVLYPDRYYTDDTVVNFFKSLNDISEIPIFIHAMPMRNAKGGQYDYTASLINKIIDACPRVIGMKEECSSFEVGYDLCRGIKDKDFQIIVAGKSQRRFSLLYGAGTKTFLAGVGSMYPRIDIEYYNYMINNDQEAANNFVKYYENPVFDVFMKSWHKYLRIALNLMGFGYSFNRQPWPNTTEEEKEEVRKCLKLLEEGK